MTHSRLGDKFCANGGVGWIPMEGQTRYSCLAGLVGLDWSGNFNETQWSGQAGAMSEPLGSCHFHFHRN